MRLITFPVACNVLMTVTSAIIIHIFKLNCGSHVMRILLARTMINDTHLLRYYGGLLDSVVERSIVRFE